VSDCTSDGSSHVLHELRSLSETLSRLERSFGDYFTHSDKQKITAPGVSWFGKVISKLNAINDAQLRLDQKMADLVGTSGGVNASFPSRSSVARTSAYRESSSIEAGFRSSSIRRDFREGDLRDLAIARSASQLQPRLSEVSPSNSPRGNDVNLMCAAPVDRRSNKISASRLSVHRPSSHLALALPARWPETVEIRECLRPRRTENSQDPEMGMVFNHSRSITNASSRIYRAEMKEQRQGQKTCSKLFGLCRLVTNSPQHIIFQLFGLFVLVVDLTLIPYTVVWGIPLGGFWFVLAILTGCFWTVDIGANLITKDGYGEDVDHAVLSRKYISSWFLVDLGIVMCDWGSIASTVSLGGGSVRLVRIAKLTRFLRVIGLLRMVRLRNIVAQLRRRVSEEGVFFFNVIMILVAVMWINHIICCAWYGGAIFLHSDTGTRWIDHYADFSNSYVYLTSLHWCTAQMTLGATEVAATNSLERIFNIGMLLWGLVSSAVLVSSLSARLIAIQGRKSEQDRMLRQLREFLFQNQVDSTITVRANKQAEKRMAMKQSLRECDVHALALLSSSLQAEVRYHVYRRHFLSHPLFRLCSTISLPTARNLCSEAVDFRFLQCGDELFMAGTKGEEAYYVVDGSLTYEQNPESSAVNEFVKVMVHEASWLCEASLWTTWTHVGTAIADTELQALTIGANMLMSIMKQHELIEQIFSEYGKAFHEAVISSKPPGSSWPSDLAVPGTSFEELVAAMSGPSRQVIGLNALECLSSGWNFTGERHLEALSQQVWRGGYVIFTNGAEVVERVSFSVEVCIERGEDGALFAQLGEVDETHVTTKLEFPSRTREQGEGSFTAVDDMIRDRLSPLAGRLTFDRIEEIVELTETLPGRLVDKDRRTRFFARLEGHANMDRYSVAAPPPLRTSWQCPDRRTRHGSIFVSGHLSTSERVPTAGQKWNDLMQNCQVYAFNCNGRVALYTWLPPYVIESLRTAEGDRQVARWVKELNVDINVPCVEVATCSSTLFRTSERWSDIPRNVKRGSFRASRSTMAVEHDVSDSSADTSDFQHNSHCIVKDETMAEFREIAKHETFLRDESPTSA